MVIKLVDLDTYNKLVTIQKEYPALTYQNKGYDCLDKSKLSEKEVEVFNEVSDVLKEYIEGFSEFNHFTTSVSGTIKLRFQYNWNHHEPDKLPFIGVGYLELETLLKGFNNEN